MEGGAARTKAEARGTGISSRSFRGRHGGGEHFIAVEVPAALDFTKQLSLLEDRYQAARKALDLGPETAVFRRVFLSDVMNQAAPVRNSRLAGDVPGSPVAVSIVQQAPLSGAKLALLAYHVASPDAVVKTRLGPRHVLMTKNGVRHLWSTRLCAGDDRGAADSAAQTREVFDDLIAVLKDQGGTLRDNCVRTWIYLKDVDVFYQGMVDSRRALFAREGLTSDTHFIASTGIEGACAHRYDLVAMDAYSVLDLAPRQVSYLNDYERLCPTAAYNVTFERATRIAYADRAQLFISGTASIDREGQVLHPGDVLRQLERALGNVEALLKAGRASLRDMMYFIVYLRDPTDHARVAAYLRERFAELPTLIVQGAVCRPDWLVEVEGVGVARHDDPALPAF